jgi:hypothetical protein
MREVANSNSRSFPFYRLFLSLLLSYHFHFSKISSSVSRNESNLPLVNGSSSFRGSQTQCQSLQEITFAQSDNLSDTSSSNSRSLKYLDSSGHVLCSSDPSAKYWTVDILSSAFPDGISSGEIVTLLSALIMKNPADGVKRSIYLMNSAIDADDKALFEALVDSVFDKNGPLTKIRNLICDSIQKEGRLQQAELALSYTQAKDQLRAALTQLWLKSLSTCSHPIIESIGSFLSIIPRIGNSSQDKLISQTLRRQLGYESKCRMLPDGVSWDTFFHEQRKVIFEAAVAGKHKVIEVVTEFRHFGIQRDYISLSLAGSIIGGHEMTARAILERHFKSTTPSSELLLPLAACIQINSPLILEIEEYFRRFKLDIRGYDPLLAIEFGKMGWIEGMNTLLSNEENVSERGLQYIQASMGASIQYGNIAFFRYFLSRLDELKVPFTISHEFRWEKLPIEEASRNEFLLLSRRLNLFQQPGAQKLARDLVYSAASNNMVGSLRELIKIASDLRIGISGLVVTGIKAAADWSCHEALIALISDHSKWLCEEKQTAIFRQLISREFRNRNEKALQLLIALIDISLVSDVLISSFEETILGKDQQRIIFQSRFLSQKGLDVTFHTEKAIIARKGVSDIARIEIMNMFGFSPIISNDRFHTLLVLSCKEGFTSLTKCLIDSGIASIQTVVKAICDLIINTIVLNRTSEFESILHSLGDKLRSIISRSLRLRNILGMNEIQKSLNTGILIRTLVHRFPRMRSQIISSDPILDPDSTCPICLGRLENSNDMMILTGENHL